MEYLLGIDVGTSATKVLLMERGGRVAASASGEYPMLQPHNGWAEQDPEEWWRAVEQACRSVLEQTGIQPEQIAGIGLSGQMHGLVMLDEDDRVIRPCILWCDQRTGAECGELTELVGAERLFQITCSPALTGFTASKWLWVRRHEPEHSARCRKILLPKDYIRFRLTGEYATDVSDASGTQFMDIRGRCWSQEILDALGLERAMLPALYESPEQTGRVTAQAAARTGLAPGTPVVAGGGDNAASAIGMGIVHPGDSFLSIGTSGVLFAHTDQPMVDPKGRAHTFCCAVPGAWHMMGVTQGAGLSLQWLRDQCCGDERMQAAQEGCDPYVVMDREAEQVRPGAQRLYYLPYLMGERTPHLDADCRGVFFGLSAIHKRPHLIRAVMEGVGYSMRDCQQVLEQAGVQLKETALCGGGAVSPLWREIMCNILNLPVYTLKQQHGGAYGAAILAAVGSGLYPDVVTACQSILTRGQTQQPNQVQVEVYAKLYPLYTELYQALKDEFKALAALPD